MGIGSPSQMLLNQPTIEWEVYLKSLLLFGRDNNIFFFNLICFSLNGLSYIIYLVMFRGIKGELSCIREVSVLLSTSLKA